MAIELLEEKISSGDTRPLDWFRLSANPSAMPIISRYPDLIVWSHLSSNSSAMELLYQNRDKIDIRQLAKNKHPQAMELLSELLNEVDMATLERNETFKTNISMNPNALDILSRFPNFICPRGLMLNTNEQILQIAFTRTFQTDYWFLSNSSPSLTSQIRSRILSYGASSNWISCAIKNENPEIVSLIERYILDNPNEIRNDTYLHLCLSKNQHAVALLEQQPWLIVWDAVWSNPGIFEQSQI
jgi:hypothetical protein